MDAGTLPWPVLVAPFVGSFLATVAIRLSAGEGFVAGRSACRRCGRRLTARELVPLASWLAQRGRCRGCGGAIDPLHPVVEALAVVAALWAWLTLPGMLAWAGAGLGWTLLVLAAIDLRHQILPDVLVVPLAFAGIAVATATDVGAVADHVVGGAAGGMAFLAIREVHRRLRGREGLGLGDVKLAAAAGAWVAWPGLPSVVLLAAVAGLGVVAVRHARGRPVGAGERIAFGPFLGLGLWLVWLHGPLPGLG